MSETHMMNMPYTGTIRRIDLDYIQITPPYGFWLRPTDYDYISQHFQVGDDITLMSDRLTGFVTRIEEPTSCN